MLCLSCYILADTFFVSKGFGANGLTALNLVIPIYSFIYGSGLLFGIGGATKYSILRSQNEKSSANRVFTNTVFLALCLATVFCVIGIFFSESVTQILGADETVLQMGTTYLRVLLLFAPLIMLNNVFLCFIRNDGAPQLAMFAMITGSFSNVLLDYVFIFSLKMGFFGAAFASGIAQIVSLLVISSFFLRKKNNFHFVKNIFGRLISKDIISNGLPSLITETSSGVIMIVFNMIILNLQGNVGVAAYGIIANLSLVVIAIYTGIAQGIQPLISSNYGTNNHTNVKTILRYAIITMTIISGIIYICIFFNATPLVNAFNYEQNILLQNTATTGLKIYFITCLFTGLNIILSIYFTSTEHARPAHIITALRGFLIIIPMAFLLSTIGGMIGIWLVFPTTELIVSIIGITLYYFKKKNVILNNQIKNKTKNSLSV
jgi:putative MATE family efflux protein